MEPQERKGWLQAGDTNSHVMLTHGSRPSKAVLPQEGSHWDPLGQGIKPSKNYGFFFFSLP